MPIVAATLTSTGVAFLRAAEDGQQLPNPQPPSFGASMENLGTSINNPVFALLLPGRAELSSAMRGSSRSRLPSKGGVKGATPSVGVSSVGGPAVEDEPADSGEAGHAVLVRRSGDADSADEEVHLVLLHREDVLDAGADFRFHRVGPPRRIRRRAAQPLFAVNAATKPFRRGIPRSPSTDRQCRPRRRSRCCSYRAAPTHYFGKFLRNLAFWD